MSRLIPKLPDDISIQILARIPRSHYFSMKSVSPNWKKVFTSHELFRKRKELGVTEEWLYLLTKCESTKLVWYAIEPLSKNWQKLPPIPNIDNEGKNKWGFSSYIFPEFITNFFDRKNISEELPFSSCSIGTVNGCLYVLGGFSQSHAMSCVWRYDPITNTWDEVASMIVPRAYSKTCVIKNKLYVIGGVTVGQTGLLPLRSGEVYDPFVNTWCELPEMPFSKSNSTSSFFTADVHKPIVTGTCVLRERVYVTQSLYMWPFLVDIGGEIYDAETKIWGEMPIGMGEGWPTKRAATKLSVVVDRDLYALDWNSAKNSGRVMIYNEREDVWKAVIEEVPVWDFPESENPFLLANIHGRIHVVAKDADGKIVISWADVAGNKFSLSSSDPEREREKVVWEVMARLDLGAAELVSCQVLDI